MFTELCHNFFGFRKCSGRRLCVHLDEEDGVDVKRKDWDVFYVGGTVTQGIPARSNIRLLPLDSGSNGLMSTPSTPGR